MHPAIIDGKLFERTQNVIKNHSTVKEKLNHLGQILIDEKTGRNLLYYANRHCKTNRAIYFLRVNNRCKYKIMADIIEDILYKDTMKLIKRCLKDKEKVLAVLKEEQISKNRGSK